MNIKPMTTKQSAALFHHGSAVIVVANSARLVKYDD
jgi:cation transport ATPase